MQQQGFLFTDDEQFEDEAPYWPAEPAGKTDWGDFDSCLAEFGTNHCFLEGRPARVIGTPRTAEYARIEPVGLDSEPIWCCWAIVDSVMRQGDGHFIHDDDDTDE